MPEVNLNPIKRFIESQMTDRVRIYQDPEGTTDDVWDPDTGMYTPADPDTLEIYEGKAFVTPLNVFPNQSTEGGATTISTDFELHIPLESNRVPVDSVVLVVASLRNSNLVNQEFIVRSNQDNSFSIDQTLRMYAKDQRILQ